MSDTLTLTGQVTIEPDAEGASDLSGDFAIKIPLSIETTFDGKLSTTLELADGLAQAVPMAPIGTAGTFLLIKTTAPIHVIFSTSYDAGQRIQVNRTMLVDTGSNSVSVFPAVAVQAITPPASPEENIHVSVTVGAVSV